MSGDAPTIADPTHLGTDTSQSARLMVYIESGDQLRSQAVLLPDGVDVTIGRSRGCTVTVDSDRISRQHVKITREGSDVWVEDLGSRNGTRINGELIGERTRLLPGDEISVRPALAVLTTSGTLAWRRRTLSAEAFTERLRGEIDRGSRYRRVFSLALIHLRGDNEHVDRTIDRLAGRVRAMDALCDYGDNEIAVLLPELDADDAARAVDGALAGTPPNLSLRVGVASYPTHSSTADDLIARARDAQRRSSARSTIAETDRKPLPDSVIAEAPATKALFHLIEKVAPSMMTVLILGETGAGKEVTAHSIHRASARAGGPFVVLNCACLPATLLESELFGHEKGAFTGADQQKIGYFEAANGGTLFLDEIGEIEPALQAKLLRVLESHKLIRVGGTRELPVDVRVVCATNRDLEVEVREGRFRSDLFFRIAGFTVAVPPLRERRADVRPLAERFVGEIAAQNKTTAPVLSDEAVGALERYGWPGNVRELRNALERACVLADQGVVDVDHLPGPIARAAAPAPARTSKNQLDDVEREAIRRALEEAGGNQTHAARNLGLTRRALIYRMEKHGLKPKPK